MHLQFSWCSCSDIKLLFTCWQEVWRTFSTVVIWYSKDGFHSPIRCNLKQNINCFCHEPKFPYTCSYCVKVNICCLKTWDSVPNLCRKNICPNWNFKFRQEYFISKLNISTPVARTKCKLCNSLGCLMIMF